MSDQQSSRVDISDFRDLRFEKVPDEGIELFGDLVGILFENQREREFLGVLHVIPRPNVIPEIYLGRNAVRINFQYFETLQRNHIIDSGIKIESVDIHAYVSTEKSNRYVFIAQSGDNAYILGAYNPKYMAFNATPATEMRRLFEAYVKVIPGKLERLYWVSPE